MKKFRYMIITGMLLASIGLAGCGKKSEDDITNKEIYQDDLQPLTEEELNEMDADTSDEDMKQIDEPEDEDGVAVGRTAHEAPEVDGVVYVTVTRPVKPGEFVRAKIVRTEEHDLVALQVEE